MSVATDKFEFESSERGIFLTTEINWEAYYRLLPEIIRLRLSSTDPICLFIDSPGGRTDVADELINQIRAPNQNGKQCLLTTVCVSTAASAAADILSAGDYAIAYKGSQILCHGIRHMRPQLTLEDVPVVAESLRADNERFALRLAGQMFRRLVFLATMMPTEGGSEQAVMKSIVSAPETLLQKIKENLRKDNQVLVDLVLKRQNKVSQIIAHIRKKMVKKKVTGLKAEAEILKQIVDWETRQALPATDQFSVEHILTIQEDFIQVKDYFSGQYRKRLASVCRNFGAVFFNEGEEAAFNKIPETDNAARNKYLIDVSSPKLFPFWYLVVSMCRLLQEGEYTFQAREALWLGLIDEAVGTNLPSLRKYHAWQKQEEQKQAISAPSSTVQQQPASQLPPAVERKEPPA